MNSHTLSDAISRMAWIDRLVVPIQKGIQWIYSKVGSKVEGFFHGSFLGHPLHPAIVHLPMGGFILAAITDLFQVNAAAVATSYTAILIGVIGMIPAAITGGTDWHVYGEVSVRRIGGLHMLLNFLALGLYVVSLAFRSGGAWNVGILFGYLGFFTVGFSGYLGGLLVFEKRIGTDHAPQPEDEVAPDEYVVVMSDADLHEGKPTKAHAKDVPLVLVKLDGKIYAMPNACAHEGGPLSEGKVENGCLVCPWHATAFRLADGSVESGPSVFPQPVFPVRVRNGKVEVLAVRQLEGTPALKENPPEGRASLR